ncbi:site-specific integrase [Afipia sp. 1NLS2]|uniref:tyrosine-type recombinase/integrase n=1 Tax=Afipia sp. 1NLS2 TaxID=666684 RepID=UPI0001D9E233|nr:site-specific integrase [Afipia sp. 1NLS2]EFI50016.1 integrase family protein [Afipia sp. 1NLS2]
MARKIHILSARGVATQTKIGRHADGGGLYLSISRNGGRRWVYLYRRGGRLREKGLGSASTVSLKDARLAAEAVRKQLRDGIDPIDSKPTPRTVSTFSQCAEAFITSNEHGWKNAKHRDQWRNTLKTYAEPHIGKLPVDRISVDHVLKAIEPIWTSKTETASRVRGRIEAVLDWAAARGYRSSDNPARWRGHLDKVLPPIRKVSKVRHHPALPYKDIPAFMSDLRKRDIITARALEFTILTAARTGEVVGARWDEIDTNNRVWTVPADRMKAGVEHQVPLSDRALAILKDIPKESDFIFVGMKPSEGLSNMSMLALLKRMDRADLTTHGFRSTFRDWAAETTDFPNELVEMALAHTIRNKAEAAYRRGNLLERRRAVMDAWSQYCSRGQL